jgi:hypothetical protein
VDLGHARSVNDKANGNLQGTSPYISFKAVQSAIGTTFTIFTDFQFYNCVHKSFHHLRPTSAQHSFQCDCVSNEFYLLNKDLSVLELALPTLRRVPSLPEVRRKTETTPGT